jgi:hypothetical protein
VKIAICQPTYLPWLGYFDLLDQVDAFVLLDDVQFEKRSWQQRNRIKGPSGLIWLTIPVIVHGRYEQRIREVQIENGGFAPKHLRALEMNYRRASFFNSYLPTVASVLGKTQRWLSELNVELIRVAADILRFRTPVVLASSLEQGGKRTELLANICTEVGATEYLSPIGSAAYLLDELHVLTDRGIKVTFHNYTHPEYRQLFPPFVPYACVLDLLFNEGDRSCEIIRSGRGVPFSVEQVATMVAEAQKA